MNSTTPWVRLLAASIVIAACTPPPFISPAQGGPAWTKLITDHFTVYTDMPLDDAKQVTGELQDTYAALQDIAFPYTQRVNGRFEVTLFYHQDAYLGVAPNKDKRGYFQRRSHDPDGRPMIVLYHGLDPAVREVVQHEIVHRFVGFYFPAAPTWLNEGLAQYYETMRIEEGKARVGLPPADSFFRGQHSMVVGTDQGITIMSRDEMPKLSTLLSLDAQHFYSHDLAIESTKQQWLHYAGSWSLVHAMYLGPPPFPATLDSYLTELSTGADPRAAWDKALESHGISREALEAQYEGQIDRYRTQYGILSYTPRPRAALHAQPMAEAEVRVLWGRLRPWRGPNAGLALIDFDAAVRADPRYAPAYALRGEWFAAQGRHDEALVDLRAGVALAPDDFRSSFQLASYLDGQVERKSDPTGDLRNELRGLIDRLRENAGSAEAWNLVAWYDAGLGQAERGLPFARKAIAADSSCFDCYDTAAVLLHQLGKLDDAVAAERIAVQLMPDGVRVAAMVNRLRVYERELGEARFIR